MLETRLGVPKSQTQATTSLVLSAHALACLIAGPLTGYLADRAPSRRFSLIASLGVEMIGTVIIMVAPSGMPVFLFLGKTSLICSLKLKVQTLVLGRIIEGLGGNCVWVVGLATVVSK
jgi:MFS family permease